MSSKFNAIKIILFVSLLTAVILPMTGMTPHLIFAKEAGQQITEYGLTNETPEVKRLIEKATNLKTMQDLALNRETADKIQTDIANIEFKLENMGIPTWEKYQNDPEYWLNIANQVMDEQYGIKEYHVSKNGTLVESLQPECGDCRSLSFRVGWEYQCGWFRCSYVAPTYLVLYQGQGHSQSIWYGSGHDELFPFHFVRSSHHSTSAEYTWEYDALNNGVSYDDDADIEQRYFWLANWDLRKNYANLINPFDNTELKTDFDVEQLG